MNMSNEEDECDSSNLYHIANQSDVTSFLIAQAAKITGVNSSISDDDDDDDDDEISIDLNKISSKNDRILSQSCFASFSNSSNDLTELKWLNTFKLKDLKTNKIPLNELNQKFKDDHISKLITELKLYNNNNVNSISFDVIIFLALYSKSNDNKTPWSLTLKQLYEYIQINFKQIINKRGWKNLLKETLSTNPCFIQIKHNINKLRSLWTIDTYYRPLLTRAYLNRLSLQTDKIILKNNKQIIRNVNHSFQSIVNNLPPKATVKTKALPRLYERLCEEKENEIDSDYMFQYQDNSVSDNKRPRSTSSSSYHPSLKDNDENRLSSSSPSIIKSNKRNKSENHRLSDIESTTLISNKESTIITPCPSPDHTYLNAKKSKSTKSIEDNEFSINNEDDECDSSSLTQTINKNPSIHRRKSSRPKKYLSLTLPSHRANTRINKKIIEQDLELLRQANINQQPLDLSNNSLIII